MKKIRLFLSLLMLYPASGFCGLQDAYGIAGVDGRNPSFIQRVMAAVVTAAINVYAETTNDIQTITITGTPTGGTFTLTFSGQTTGSIAFNASAGTVQQAIGALSNVVNSVVVTGGPGPGTAFVVTFISTLGSSPQNAMTATPSFTGGSSPSVSVAHTTVGAGYVNHAARASLASRILNNPALYASIFAIGVAVNSTIQTDFPAPSYAQSGGVTTSTADNDIQFTVNSIFNDYL